MQTVHRIYNKSMGWLSSIKLKKHGYVVFDNSVGAALAYSRSKEAIEIIRKIKEEYFYNCEIIKTKIERKPRRSRFKRVKKTFVNTM